MQQELHAAREPRATPQTERVIVGSGNGHLLWFDLTEEGTLRAKNELRLGGCPSFLALSPTQALAVDEHGSLLYPITQLGFEPSLGAPSASGGTGPAYVAFDRSGEFGLVANYVGGGVSVFRAGATGGAVSSQRTGQNPHAIVCSPDNRHVLVPCLGSDYVAVYRFDEASGALEPAGTAAAPLGTGPRHLTFDATGSIVYVTFEHTSEVGVFAWDAGAGRLELVSLISTLGTSAGRAPNTASHIELHPSGRALYASNRGDDSLAVFAVDGKGGIVLQERVATGKKPRHFSVNGRGNRLLVGNLD
ncbi:MAG TPA: beta-propeller fold lactonase family protein, partial [Polyangiaceae bacterium]|nr:beta-propeller fold lactonase family protein [Polyangiaceae bacterium]